jgi:hypothetical protein
MYLDLQEETVCVAWISSKRDNRNLIVRACSESVLYHECHKRRNKVNENAFPPAAMVRTSQMHKEEDLFTLTLG